MLEINGAGYGGAPGVRRWERKLTALARQIDDPEALGQVLDLVDHLNRQIGTAVRDLYAEGHSTADLGAALGISRQAVAKRWPRSERER